MGFGRYLARRVTYTIILLLIIVCFNFFLFQVLPFATSCPGQTFNKCVDELYVPPITPHGSLNVTHLELQEEAAVLKLYGFDQPIYTRFFLYVKAMFSFQFGYNIGGVLGGPVINTIETRLPFTVILLGSATVAGFLIGVLMGVVAAAKRGKILDISSLAGLLFVNALPVFFLGAMLEIFQLGLTGGFYRPVGTTTALTAGTSFVYGYLQALFLPFLTLTLATIGGVFLTQRAVMIDTVQEDYILMARAKGLPEKTVLYKHAFRNAVLPITTAFAITIGFILSGAVVTETVFGWPGLGQAIYLAVTQYDFPLEQAIFFIITMMVLIAVFAADMIYGVLDPRVSTG